MAQQRKTFSSRKSRSSKTSHENPQNSKKDEIVWTWEIVKDLWMRNFSVMITDLGQAIIAYPSWKMKMFNISLLPWDRVDVKISPEDRTKGVIVYRHKPWSS